MAQQWFKKIFKIITKNGNIKDQTKKDNFPNDDIENDKMIKYEILKNFMF